MKKKNFGLFVLIFFLINLTNSVAQEKFIFIDVNYIFNNSTVGKKINKMIQDDTKRINEDLQKFNKKVVKDRKILLTQKNVVSKEEFENKVAKLEDDIKEYNSIIKKKNDKLLSLKKQARVEFTNKLNLILEQYSKENSIAMILKKENVIIGKTSLDASKEVLELFNSKVKKISIK